MNGSDGASDRASSDSSLPYGLIRRYLRRSKQAEKNGIGYQTLINEICISI